MHAYIVDRAFHFSTPVSTSVHYIHAVYLIPATPFEGLVLFYLLTVIYDVTVTIKIYLVT